MIKKILAVSLLLILGGLTSLIAQEQNLAELARKERERRQNLKSEKVKLITNKDLENLKKTPALIMKEQEVQTSSDNAPEGAAQSSSAPSVVHRVTVESPAGAPASSSSGVSAGQPGSSTSDQGSSTLETAWKKAQEYVELLTLKMNALWQEFYSLDDMTSRDHIQRQISETYEKLIKAQEEEARLRAEYEKQINQKKSEGANPIWIK
ncbi:MAG: hypothetical protein ACPLRX_06440 [Candidatus Saccharicenans sp.]